MKVIVPTYKEISWILPCYKFFHEKYWGVPFVILAEKSYIADCEYGIPPYFRDDSDDFSNVLIWYLERIEDDFVIIMLSDYLITSKVNVETINVMFEYMKLHNNVLRCQLGDYVISDKSTKTEILEGVDMYEGGFLATSLTPGIWNKNLLLGMLENNWTAWDVELRCNDIFLENNMRSICPIPEPINYINAIRGRNSNTIVITQDLLKEIRKRIPNNITIWDTTNKLNISYI